MLSLCGASERVMMGFCAESAEEGVGALKAWVSALELPRGRLHGMDKDGVALDMSDFGAVYIKYSSTGGEILSAGDATLNGMAGMFAGNVDPSQAMMDLIEESTSTPPFPMASSVSMLSCPWTSSRARVASPGARERRRQSSGAGKVSRALLEG